MSEAEPLLEDVLARPDLHPEDRQITEQLQAIGRSAWTGLLEHLHGTATPSATPDLLKLRRMIVVYNEQVSELSRTISGAG